LIPFLKNELTAGIYPLKINEYLAVGKPVVTTNFADLTDFEEMVHIAPCQESFLKELKTSMTQTSPKWIYERTLFALENSWEKRAQELNMML